ncbi:protein of unknown function [Taphrina deformans PYCC 5710]|uniref:Uncharacterized protein n=1 Tax=Taphrina deformans (strain PYCC 5710 / ATCC 11124 / CBS 356.35 / IMI 108563 / JCM 9778 / NBRC 8474) TaxID=1097556 RepID=R4XAS7_TAPDE|nr:protein of unknown function [Taphrina deformans PYCC 5710]|eukprot:CCG82634.1 protein of unknown function [Taphrina deformans PYCC 5710]
MSVAAELNNHLDLALIGTEEEDRSKRHEALTKLVTKDKESDPVNKLLFRRLQALMQDAMSGTDITGTKIASAGLDDLSAEVETLLMNVKKNFVLMHYAFDTFGQSAIKLL